VIRNQKIVAPMGLPPGSTGVAVPSSQTTGLQPPVPWSEMLADRRSKGIVPPAKVAGKVELTFVGSFPNPWAGKPKEEGKAVLASPSPWEPSTDTFAAAAGGDAKVIVATSFLSILGEIALKPKGSVKVVNIFTHGEKTQLGFQGTITPGSVQSTVMWIGGPLDVLSLETLETLEEHPERPYYVQRKNSRQRQKFTFAEILERLGKDAQINVFSCHSGQDKTFLQSIANVFQAKVTGFEQPIRYVAKVGADGFIQRDRTTIGLGVAGTKDAVGAVKDFRQLIGKGVSVNPKK
jgi:hypothetical protein